MKSLLSLHFSIEVSTFSLLVYWNHDFLLTFLLKRLLSFYSSVEISTFSLLFYRNLYFLFTIYISTGSLLFYLHLYWLCTFLVKSLLSLYFSFETSTFPFFFYWDLCPHVPLHHICTSITLRKAITPCFPQCNYAHKKFKEKLCPELDGSRAETAPAPRRTQRLTPLAFTTPCTQIYCENTGVRTLPFFQTYTLSHACHANCHLLTEPPHDRASQLWATSWLLYLLTACATSAPALHCEKESCLASPNVNTHTKISKKSYAQN